MGVKLQLTSLGLLLSNEIMKPGTETKLQIIPMGASPIAKVLAIIMKKFVDDDLKLSCMILETPYVREVVPDNERTLLVLADGNPKNYRGMNVNEETVLSWNCPVLYFRLLPDGNDSVHPLGFLAKGTGVKSLIIEFPGDFTFYDDTGLIEIMKNWILELWGADDV